MRLGEQALKLAVLAFELCEPLRFKDIHAAKLGSPFVETGIAESVLFAQVFERHARLHLLQEANDLLFAVFALSHTYYSPKVLTPSEEWLVR